MGNRGGDFVSPEGLRQDGRRPLELRSLSAKMSVLPKIDGSAIFELGNTRVLATVCGPREMRSRGGSDLSSSSSTANTNTNTNTNTNLEQASISVRFHASTFSSASGERRRTLRLDRRMTEWARLVEETFSQAIIRRLFPRSALEITVEVLAADGAVLAAAINAVTLALCSAGVPLYDYVVASTVCVVPAATTKGAVVTGGPGVVLLLDANRQEEAANATVTMAAWGRTPTAALLVQMESGTAGGSNGSSSASSSVGGDRLEGMMEMAGGGIKRIFELLDETVVRSTVGEMMSSKMGAIPSSAASVTV